MIGASMQAPLAGLVLVLEFTHSGFSLDTHDGRYRNRDVHRASD